jgi:MoaE-MoaD fusion protein
VVGTRSCSYQSHNIDRTTTTAATTTATVATAATTMKVVCVFFAKTAELAKTDQVQLDVADGMSVGAFVALILERFPALALLNGSTMVAVNMEYLDPIKEDGSFDSNLVLNNGDEVALIPPVSGG